MTVVCALSETLLMGMELGAAPVGNREDTHPLVLLLTLLAWRWPLRWCIKFIYITGAEKREREFLFEIQKSRHVCICHIRPGVEMSVCHSICVIGDTPAEGETTAPWRVKRPSGPACAFCSHSCKRTREILFAHDGTFPGVSSSSR